MQSAARRARERAPRRAPCPGRAGRRRGAVARALTHRRARLRSGAVRLRAGRPVLRRRRRPRARRRRLDARAPGRGRLADDARLGGFQRASRRGDGAGLPGRRRGHDLDLPALRGHLDRPRPRRADEARTSPRHRPGDVSRPVLRLRRRHDRRPARLRAARWRVDGDAAVVFVVSRAGLPRRLRRRDGRERRPQASCTAAPPRRARWRGPGTLRAAGGRCRRAKARRLRSPAQGSQAARPRPRWSSSVAGTRAASSRPRCGRGTPGAPGETSTRCRARSRARAPP